MVHRFKEVENMLRAIQFVCPCCSICEDDPNLLVDKDCEIGELLVEKRYKIGEVIGQGRLGVVHKCIHRTNRQEFACKIMPTTKSAYNEITILESHLYNGPPGILRIRDHCWLEQDRLSKNVYMISELCDGGDLQHLLNEQGRAILPARHTATIIQSLVQSLEFCQSRKVIHRDVKPSSIFRATSVNSSSWAFKLGNFDLAIWQGNINVVTDNVGTLGFSAPEMLRGKGYSYEVDIWSAGVVFYLLLCGKKPFDAENEDVNSMYHKIQNTKPDSSGVWRYISDSVKELVLGMLQMDPMLRFSCHQILSHPWIMAHAEMNLQIPSSTINSTERMVPPRRPLPDTINYEKTVGRRTQNRKKSHPIPIPIPIVCPRKE